MVHLYYGNGKGKTTAACGLAVRAVGSGMRVLWVQFFKDGSSSENSVLTFLPQVDVLIPKVFYGWLRDMTEEQKEETRKCYSSVLQDVEKRIDGYDLLVLDEVVFAHNHGLIDHEMLMDILLKNKMEKEIILTGRDPAPEICKAADYMTEMKKIKHPFGLGVTARKGIEY